MKLQIKDSGTCPAHSLAAVVPPDWKQFVEACAEGENCTVNISAIARRAKKLLGGAGSGLVQPVAPAAPAAQGDAKELTEKVIRVLEGYAENYDMMSRIGKTGDVDCRSVAHDIRRNMVDGVRAAIASKRTGQ